MLKLFFEHALAGKIDLIITKSISRFARNTVDTLTTVRKLKEKGIEVFFEKENIRTLDGKGELLITIMSSLAQEESRSISENVTWGQRKRFADGKVSLPYRHFLGYQKGPDNLPEIVEEEAVIVRLIYRMFLYGKSPSAIASHLTDEGIPTPGGKAIWRAKVIENILTNEKYKGDALLQKRYTVDFLTKKQKVNEGEVPQYYVANSHPAIIEPEIFDLVQYELKRRKKDGRWTSSTYPFSGKIICGECGGIYGSKVWHSNTPNRTLVWQCNEKHRGQNCRTPHLTDADIQTAFLAAFNKVLGNRAEIMEAYQEVVEALTDTRDLDTEQEQLASESEVTMELIRKGSVQPCFSGLFGIKFIIMEFPYVHICAILSDDRINDGAVKALITKEVQERDVIDSGGLKEASAFERIRLLCFLYFCHCKFPGSRVRVQDFEGLSSEGAVWEHDGHPGEVSADIKPDREVMDAVNANKGEMIMWQFAVISRLPYFYGKTHIYMVIYRSKDKNTTQGNLAELVGSPVAPIWCK